MKKVPNDGWRFFLCRLKFYFTLAMLRFIWLLAVAFVLEGCTCCAYLNHMFNAERQYEEAGEMRAARLDSTQSEHSRPSSEEAAKYDKVIEKGSHVLERFPDNKKRTAEAVFLIAESYRHKRECDKAVIKYDEFERYFADHDSMPTVEYQRAFCLYENGEYNIARFALEPVIAKGKEHPYYFQGLNLLSLIEEQSSDPGQAIAALEALLADTAGTPFMRGKAHFRLATLYYDNGSYLKAREHYIAPEIDSLVVRDRYRAKTQAAECLANVEKYDEAATEYLAIAKNVDFQDDLQEILVRYGELLYLAKKFADGSVVFHKVTEDYPKSEEAARAFYWQGNHEQVDLRAYETALAYYDSGYTARPSSKWGKDCKDLYEALKRLLILQSNNDDMDSLQRLKKPFFDNEFQIAELFLFKLSEVDSAVTRLTNIIEASAEDSTRMLKAMYARAFITDEFLHDPETAEEYYNEIIELFPESDFAKQAQANMGQRVTLKTREDVAHERFLAAESLWLAAEALPVEAMDQVDSAYVLALAAYDSVYREFEDTQAGIQALYMTAMILAMTPEGLDSAGTILQILREKHGATKWGQSAAKLLSTRLSIDDKDLERLRKRMQQNAERSDKLSKQYYEEYSLKKQEERHEEVKAREDEILENTYNSMYDFE